MAADQPNHCSTDQTASQAPAQDTALVLADDMVPTCTPPAMIPGFSGSPINTNPATCCCRSDRAICERTPNARLSCSGTALGTPDAALASHRSLLATAGASPSITSPISMATHPAGTVSVHCCAQSAIGSAIWSVSRSGAPSIMRSRASRRISTPCAHYGPLRRPGICHKRHSFFLG